MNVRFIKISLIIILVPIFLFLFTKKVSAGCSFIGSWEGCGSCPTCYMQENQSPPPDSYAMCCTCIGGWRAWFVCDNCGQCGGGCFVEGTEIETKSQSDKEIKEIEKLEPGEIVSSFNPETGKISESQVAEVHKVTREGYYELETESGKKVKVTGEHPFLAVKSEENLISKLKNALSNSLTLRLITTFQTKLIEVLD